MKIPKSIINFGQAVLKDAFSNSTTVVQNIPKANLTGTICNHPTDQQVVNKLRMTGCLKCNVWCLAKAGIRITKL